MILLNDKYVSDEKADKVFDKYFLGEIENKIEHNGKYKIIRFI